MHDRARRVLAPCLAAVLGSWGIGVGTARAQATPEAQEVRFGSSPNPVGSGARALGIASAFIATADDATAASWNPGALIVLERPEVSVVFDAKRRNETFEGATVAAQDREQSSNWGGLNYVSFAYPFKWKSRFFVASLNFQSLIDFEKVAQITTVFADAGALATRTDRFVEQGRLRALSPALAFQLSPYVAVGVTLNLWTSKLGYQNGWSDRRETRLVRTLGNSSATTDLVVRQRFSFDGAGANFGVLWDVSPRWTVGAVFKTPTWGTAERKLEELTSTTLGADGTEQVLSQKPRSFDEPMRWPPSYGVGVAYRHSDKLTVSADLYRTEWGLFRRRDTDVVTEQHRAINPISGELYSDAEVSGITQAHLGGEYLFILPRTVVPVRGGLFYDPEPGQGETDHFFGLALGTGVSLTDAVLEDDLIIDVAYQLRAGPGADPNVIDIPSTASGRYLTATGGSVWQHLLYLSAIQHF